MAKGRRLPEEVAGLEIIDITEDGRGIGKSEGRVIFVEGAIPGDLAGVEFVRRKKSLFEGKLKSLDRSSPHRVEPFCSHFRQCGGCKWQHLDYPAQLAYKQKQVKDALERLGGIDASHIEPIIESSETRWYRNKLDFAFSSRRWLSPAEMLSQAVSGEEGALGFHVPGRFDKILDIQRCYLQAEPSNEIRNTIRDYASSRGFSFYDPRAHTGLLRNLIIRNTSAGELMVIMVFGAEQPDAIAELMNFIAGRFPQITSLMYVINRKVNDTIADQEVLLWSGRDYILEQMDSPGGPLRFRIGPKTFYQTNSLQAARLYAVVAAFAGLSGKERVYDLYTGAGTIANYLARQAEWVHGIEYVEPAIVDARENSALNGIANTSFFAGDIRKVLDGPFLEAQGRPDVVITDPPRAGMHAHVVLRLRDIAPDRIVYVSCNPATQARDLLILKEDYEVSRIQPVDMFPHTTHVENVVLLTRRNHE